MQDDWTRDGCDRPETVAAYANLTDDELTVRLGQPHRQSEFALGAGMNEFRIELLNQFPLPANANLQVTERTWKHERCNLTIWSVQQETRLNSVIAVRWPADALF